MKISIIGAGALGKLYGGLLALAGHDVSFLLRSEYNLIHQQAYFEIDLKENQQTLRVNDPNVYHKASELPAADLIIVTVKTTENSSLKTLLQDTIQDNSSILVIQNGIGNEEYIQALFPQHNIISAISTAAVTRAAKGKIDVYFLGELRIASAFEVGLSNLSFETLFNRNASPNVVYYDNFKLMRWQKLIWNVPFCALSIIYNLSTDILAKQLPYSDIVLSIMKEVQSIALSENAKIEEEYIDKTLHVSKGVKNYFPSMYWDYKNNNVIELEYIFENVLKVAQKNQVKAPLIHLIYQHLLHLLQTRNPK